MGTDAWCVFCCQCSLLPVLCPSAELGSAFRDFTEALLSAQATPRLEPNPARTNWAGGGEGVRAKGHFMLYLAPGLAALRIQAAMFNSLERALQAAGGELRIYPDRLKSEREARKTRRHAAEGEGEQGGKKGGKRKGGKKGGKDKDKDKGVGGAKGKGKPNGKGGKGRGGK
jgi:hypothetical protein